MRRRALVVLLVVALRMMRFEAAELEFRAWCALLRGAGSGFMVYADGGRSNGGGVR